MCTFFWANSDLAWPSASSPFLYDTWNLSDKLKERCLLPAGSGMAWEMFLAWQSLVTNSVSNRIVFLGLSFVPGSCPDGLLPGEWIITFLVDLLQWIRVQWCTVVMCWLHTRTESWQALTFQSCLLCRTELQASYTWWHSERGSYCRVRNQEGALPHTGKFRYHLKAVSLAPQLLSGTDFPINVSVLLLCCHTHWYISVLHMLWNAIHHISC